MFEVNCFIEFFIQVVNALVTVFESNSCYIKDEIGTGYGRKELMFMLKFGKKVNYRPLLVSLGVALIVGLLFGLNISKLLGWEIGTIMFLLMILGHYWLVMPIIFNYWYSTDSTVNYSDINKLSSRLLMIFLPFQLHLKTINKNQITAITLLGLPQRNPNLGSELLVSEEGGFMYNILLMINEPVKVRLGLANGQTIDLDLSQDFVAHQSETLGKLRIFLSEFNPAIVYLSNETRKAIND